jgi:predicted lipid-binding transport protein (Tim44 family)
MAIRMIETILFAFFTVYILFRLWSVLGKRTGFVAPPRESEDRPSETGDNVIALPSRVISQPKNSMVSQETDTVNLAPALETELMKITEIDTEFHLDHFLQGAINAFEIIVTAFARGDKETLKSLLSPGVFESFSGVLQDRAELGQTVDTKIIDIKKPDVTNVEIKRKQEQITLRFTSEQIVVTTNAEGKIIDNPARLSLVMKDIWTFSRTINSPDPNWVLVATRVEGN